LFVVLYFMCRLLQIYFYLFYFFFFFKQKTAYEITRRDWSSDVCSSDLLDGGGTFCGSGGALTLPITADDTDSRSEEHTSELQSRLVISYAVFCLKKK